MKGFKLDRSSDWFFIAINFTLCSSTYFCRSSTQGEQANSKNTMFWIKLHRQNLQVKSILENTFNRLKLFTEASITTLLLHELQYPLNILHGYIAQIFAYLHSPLMKNFDAVSYSCHRFDCPLLVYKNIDQILHCMTNWQNQFRYNGILNDNSYLYT